MNIILFPILLVLIGILLIFFSKSIRPKLLRLLSWKVGAIFTGLYLGVLSMFVPVLYMLPDKDFIKTDAHKDQAIVTSQNLINNLYNQHFPAEKDLAKLEGIYKNSSQTFPVDSSKLSFNQQTTGSYHVLIERKGVDDGEINISTYVTAQYIGDVNFSKRLFPPVISLKNGILSIRGRNYQSFEFKHFNSDFTVDQFENQNSRINEMSHFGDQIIFIRVPKSLDINKGESEGQIHFI